MIDDSFLNWKRRVWCGGPLGGSCRCQGGSSWLAGHRRGRGNIAYGRELANGMVVVDAVLVSQIEIGVLGRDEAVGVVPGIGFHHVLAVEPEGKAHANVGAVHPFPVALLLLVRPAQPVEFLVVSWGATKGECAGVVVGGGGRFGVCGGKGEEWADD